MVIIMKISCTQALAIINGELVIVDVGALDEGDPPNLGLTLRAA